MTAVTSRINMTGGGGFVAAAPVSSRKSGVNSSVTPNITPNFGVKPDLN